MKPVELIERALENSTKAGDIVVDLFGGSGSTLIGCKRRNRSARLMEIDPCYADVIVRRWQDYTGKKATLEGGGRTFEGIAEQRLDQNAEIQANPTGAAATGRPGDPIGVVQRLQHRGFRR